MKQSQKRKPVQKRPAPTANNKEETRGGAQPTAEDERDLRDAERALAEAKRKGLYPWEWLKQEIEQ
jgi:hypothetical protein